MGFIVVERIRVLQDRMAFELSIPDPALRQTDPALARRVAAVRPHLCDHACVNSQGRRFSDVIERTPMPHLLEHCIIDFLVEDASDLRDSFQGTSRWVDLDSGRALVQISMKDDLAVLRAFKRALRLLEEEVMLR